MMFPPKFGFKIAAIADLGDDVAISVRCKDFIAFENVGMVEFLHDVVNPRARVEPGSLVAMLFLTPVYLGILVAESLQASDLILSVL